MKHDDPWEILCAPIHVCEPYAMRRRRFWRRTLWFAALVSLIAGASVGWWA